METLSTKTHIARKEHRCDWCGQKIEKGEKYEYSFIVDGGDNWTFKNHLSCRELTNKLNMWNDATWGEGVTDDLFCDIINDKYIDITGDGNFEEMENFKDRIELVKNNVLCQKQS